MAERSPDAGDHDTAVRYYRRLLGNDSCGEPAHLQEMCALAWAGTAALPRLCLGPPTDHTASSWSRRFGCGRWTSSTMIPSGSAK